MTASSKSAVNMSTVMRDISDALCLDRNDRKEEAYRKYLECVLRITTKLLKDLHSGGGHVTFNKDVTRFVKLGQQCMDRVASIAVDQGATGPPQIPKTLYLPGTTLSLQSPTTPGEVSVTSPNSTVTAPATVTDSQSRVKKLTPMEIAVKHNQQLLAAFKARKTGKNTSLSASQNLALTIQRKMAENLAIAKAREDALAKKMRERQKRLEEQAARRFHTPIGLSEEELHQRQIYTKILEFEQEEIWMIDMRKQLEASPDDVIVIFTLIERVLSCDTHPLTQQLKLYQEKTLQQLYPLVQNKTEQVNQISVPLSESALSNLLKHHKDHLNTFSKQAYIAKTELKCSEERLEEVDNKCEKEDEIIDDVEPKDSNTEEKMESSVSITNQSETVHYKKELDSNSIDVTTDTLSIEHEIPDCENNKEKGTDVTEMGKYSVLNDKNKDNIKNTDEQSHNTASEIKCENKATECTDKDTNGNETKYSDHDKINSMSACDVENKEYSKYDQSETNQSTLDVSSKDQVNDSSTSTCGNQPNDSENTNMGVKSVDEKTVADEDCDADLKCNEDFFSDKKKSDVDTSERTEDKDADLDKTDSCVSSAQDLANVTDDIKQDLKAAMVKSQKLRDSLEMENRKLKSMSRQVTLEYEKYNAENMDDLFDDEEDENEIDSALENSVYSTISGTSYQSGKSDINEKVSNKNDILNDKQEIESSNLDSNESDSSIDVNANDESVLNNTHFKEESSNKEGFPNNLSFQSLESSIKQLRNEAYYRHLKNITEDILTSIEKIQVLFVIGFEQLDTAEGRDQCNVLVEKHFFKPIWKYLLRLFRLASEPKEIAIAHLMTIKEGSKPADFSVREKLCLPPNSSCDDNDYPYKAAVLELCQVVEKPTMLEKLDCLVKTSRQVVDCVDQYYEKEKDGTEKPSIGADDLLPVLCYVVAQCKIPQIVSECQAMERFIHEGYMYGEEGYCLTSFQTAINYLISEGMKAAVNEKGTNQG